MIYCCPRLLLRVAACGLSALLVRKWPTGPLQIFDTVGTPVFNPGVSDALAFDNVTVPGQPAAWVWSQRASGLYFWLIYEPILQRNFIRLDAGVYGRGRANLIYASDD